MKSEILGGIYKTEECYIEALDKTVPLRSLSGGEWSQIRSQRTARMRAYGKAMEGGDVTVDFSLGESQEDEFLADVYAVKYGLAVTTDKTDRWSVEEVKMLPTAAIEEIAAKVYELSGVDAERGELLDKARDEVESFRSE